MGPHVYPCNVALVVGYLGTLSAQTGKPNTGNLEGGQVDGSSTRRGTWRRRAKGHRAPGTKKSKDAKSKTVCTGAVQQRSLVVLQHCTTYYEFAIQFDRTKWLGILGVCKGPIPLQWLVSVGHCYKRCILAFRGGKTCKTTLFKQREGSEEERIVGPYTLYTLCTPYTIYTLILLIHFN